MPADPRNRSHGQQPWTRPGLALGLVLIVLLALPLSRAEAANTHATLVQPSATGKAKTARQALLKQRTTVIGVSARHPGTTVGAAGSPPPKTIVTKRFLPK